MQEDETYDPKTIPENIAMPYICNLPAEINYLLVVSQPSFSTNKEAKVNAITFREFSQTFESLMSSYF